MYTNRFDLILSVKFLHNLMKVIAKNQLAYYATEIRNIKKTIILHVYRSKCVLFVKSFHDSALVRYYIYNEVIILYHVLPLSVIMVVTSIELVREDCNIKAAVVSVTLLTTFLLVVHMNVLISSILTTS